MRIAAAVGGMLLIAAAAAAASSPPSITSGFPVRLSGQILDAGIHVDCSRATTRCTGVARVALVDAGAARVVGRRELSLVGGDERPVRVRITRTAARRLRAPGKVRLRILVRVRADGGEPVELLRRARL